MMHRSDADVLYPPSSIRFLKRILGQEFMSPVGSAEVEPIKSGIMLQVCDVLDFGCGSVGATMYLVTRYFPAPVPGSSELRLGMERF